MHSEGETQAGKEDSKNRHSLKAEGDRERATETNIEMAGGTRKRKYVVLVQGVGGHVSQKFGRDGGRGPA